MAALLFLPGCAFEPQALPDLPDGRTPDAPASIDARGDAPAAPDAAPPDGRILCNWPVSPDLFDPCDLPQSNGDLNVNSGAVYNTDSHALTMGATTVLFQRTVPQPDGPDLEMVVFDQVTITGVLVKLLSTITLVLAPLFVM